MQQVFTIQDENVATMDIFHCYILSCGFHLEHFYPKTELDKLVGAHCFNIATVANTEMVLMVDMNGKPELISFSAFEQTLLKNYGIVMTMTQSKKNKILIWKDSKFQFLAIDSSLQVITDQTESIHIVNHLLASILSKETSVIGQLRQLQNFSPAKGREVRNVMTWLLGPDLGKENTFHFEHHYLSNRVIYLRKSNRK